MAEKYVEREVKLDVDDAFCLPNLSDLVPAGGTLATVTVPVDSTYFDTAQQDLLKANMTLRRRAGEPSDTGWQLKVPAMDARTEHRLPTTAGGAVPKEFRDLTAGLRRGRGLRQVARIRTERTAHRLFDAGGALLVEVADDRVHSATLGDEAVISTWREVEVELGCGGPDLSKKIVKRLRAGGARHACAQSKLARAVATPAASGLQPSSLPASGGHATVGDLVLTYLIEQRQGLRKGDMELRGGSDAIHHTRVAARRWRSTLRCFHSLFDADRAAAMEAELRWYAGLLGAVRDPDVLRVHLRAVVADLPDQLVLGPVTDRLEQQLIGERETHRRALMRALNGERYFALLDEVDRWCADPPFTEAAQAAQARVGEFARRAQHRLDKLLRVVAGNADDAHGVHRARKAAKRARYALELAAPALPAKAAKGRIAKITAIQDTLGEFQDSVVATETLLLMGIRAGTALGENGFSYGLLYALEQRRAETSRQRVIDKLR